MQKYNKIDDLFKKEAESFSPKAPDMAWDKVSSTLSKKKRAKIIKLLSIPAAASVLFVVIFGILRNDNLGHFDYIASDEIKIEKTDDNKSQKITNKIKQDIIVNNDSESIANIDNAKEKQNSQNNSNIIISESSDIKTDNSIQKQLPKNKKQFAENKAVSQNENSGTNKNKNSNNLIDENRIIEDINKNYQNINYAKFKSQVYELNIDFDVDNNPKIDYIKTFREGIFKHLSFSMVYGPTVAHRKNEKRDPEIIYTAYTNNETPLYNLSGGLNINYKLGDKFIISSGAHRSTIGLKGDYQAPTSEFQYLKLDRFGYTSAGYYEIEKANLILSAKSENTINNVRYYEKVKASFNIVEIPLIIKYKLSLRNFEIYPYAGLNASFVYDNSIELGIDDEWQALGSTQNVNNTLYGYTLGFGINYSFNENFVLGFEPGFTKYINSLNNSDEFDSKPFILKLNPVFTYKI